VVAARSRQEFLPAAGHTESGDPTALIIAAGTAESSLPQPDLPETAVKRRDRIERAMRLALIIFIVTAPLLSAGVPLDRPKSKTAAITHPKKPMIGVARRQGRSVEVSGSRP
jgi:hypothetical protein